MSVNIRVDREGADPRPRGILRSSFRKPSMQGASLSIPEKGEAGAGVLPWSPSKLLGFSLGKSRNTGAGVSSGPPRGPGDSVKRKKGTLTMSGLPPNAEETERTLRVKLEPSTTTHGPQVPHKEKDKNSTNPSGPGGLCQLVITCNPMSSPCFL